MAFPCQDSTDADPVLAENIQAANTGMSCLPDGAGKEDNELKYSITFQHSSFKMVNWVKKEY